MIRSMTGFGCAEKVWQQWTIRVEARSVNHDELKLVIRLPDVLRLWENEVGRLVQGRLKRGYVHIFVVCTLAEEALKLLVDAERLRSYVRLVKDVADSEGVPVHAEVGALIGLPGVVNSDALPQDMRQSLWLEVQATVEQTLAELVKMREAEGRSMKEQFDALCDDIARRTDIVAARGETAVRDCKAKLAARIKLLLDGVPTPADEAAIAREVAIFAEHSDVSEELTRLRSHLQQFRAALALDGEPVGRKLEFLLQEMLREANTMAAKLPAGELVQQAIEIKADIHRLREQVRNVE